MFSAPELAPTLGPLATARPLPPRAYLDERVLAFEREQLWARSWVCVGREQETLLPGEFVLAPLTPAGILVARGHDLALRGFHNVCQHRGACLEQEERGRRGRLICPYHGWSYDLDGRLGAAPSPGRPGDLDACALRQALVAEAAGLTFACAAEPWGGLDEALGGFAELFSGFPLRRLHPGRRCAHEARANWKLLAENFLESLHFSRVHPALERLTPADRAGTLAPRGAWFGGTMELREGAATVSPDGSLGGRAPLLPGARVIHDFLLFPGCMFSVQPDYLLVYRLWPLAADRTRIVSEIWFHPASAADPAFDPSPVFAFWDETNAQDRAICESQQRGIASPGYGGGRYTRVEESSHRFAAMVARCYLGQKPW